MSAIFTTLGRMILDLVKWNRLNAFIVCLTDELLPSVLFPFYISPSLGVLVLFLSLNPVYIYCSVNCYTSSLSGLILGRSWDLKCHFIDCFYRLQVCVIAFFLSFIQLHSLSLVYVLFSCIDFCVSFVLGHKKRHSFSFCLILLFFSFWLSNLVCHVFISFLSEFQLYKFMLFYFSVFHTETFFTLCPLLGCFFNDQVEVSNGRKAFF